MAPGNGWLEYYCSFLLGRPIFRVHDGIKNIQKRRLGIQSPSENGFMEPKYIAFRRWLYTPCSSSDVRWARIHRDNTGWNKKTSLTRFLHFSAVDLKFREIIAGITRNLDQLGFNAGIFGGRPESSKAKSKCMLLCEENDLSKLKDSTQKSGNFNQMSKSPSLTHTIHVRYIYLHLVDFYGVHAGKYTIHGCYGSLFSCNLNHFNWNLWHFSPNCMHILPHVQ